MKIEIRKRGYDNVIHDEVFINEKPLEMGEGVGEIFEGICEHHGKTMFIYGYNQGGYDGMHVCLQCCREIYDQIPTLFPDGPRSSTVMVVP